MSSTLWRLPWMPARPVARQPTAPQLTRCGALSSAWCAISSRYGRGCPRVLRSRHAAHARAPPRGFFIQLVRACVVAQKSVAARTRALWGDVRGRLEAGATHALREMRWPRASGSELSEKGVSGCGVQSG